MKIYKEQYAPIEDNSTYNIEKTFNDVQNHIFSIGKKQHITKKNELEEYLKAPVATVKTNILL